MEEGVIETELNETDIHSIENVSVVSRSVPLWMCSPHRRSNTTKYFTLPFHTEIEVPRSY